VSGTITWHQFVAQNDLCGLAYLLQAVGTAARQVANGAPWTTKYIVSVDLKKELEQIVTEIRTNAWLRPREKSDPTCEVWSDASSEYWAFLVFVDNVLLEAKQGRVKPDMHIFYSELATALGGLSAASRLGHKSALSFIDNAPAGGALQKGASSNFTANRWLSKRLIRDNHVTWVSTRAMLADSFTRHYPFTTTVTRLPPLGSTKRQIEALHNQYLKDKDREARSIGPVLWNEIKDLQSLTTPFQEKGKFNGQERHTMVLPFLPVHHPVFVPKRK